MDVEQQPDVKMGRELGQHICNVAIVIHSWTAQVKVADEDLRILVRDQAGDFQDLESRRTTGTRYKLDDFPAIVSLKDNAAEIKKVLDRFTAKRGSYQRGTRLVSTLMVGPMSLELEGLQRERQAMAQSLRSVWNSEFLPFIQEKFPEQFDKLVIKLPTPNQSFTRRFGVDWEFQPLNPLAGEDLDLRNLSAEERELVISRTNQMAEERAREAFDGVIEQVFGEVTGICDDILRGGLESGRRRQGALTEIMNQLDRVLNFRHLANEAVISQVREARGVLSGLDIADVNRDTPGVREAIKQTFAPLGEAVRKLQEGYGIGGNRGARDVEFE